MQLRGGQGKLIDDLISIVVPVYNIEDYIGCCIESILSQTYIKFELIIVNDGSTDSSFELCSEYANRDTRIKLYSKVNGGLSAARNFGIERATGDWLCYIDGDDVVDSTYLDTLLRNALNCNSDISICSFELIDATATAYAACRDECYKQDSETALISLYSERLSCCAAWGKLAKTSLWRNVSFPEGRRYEDFSRIDSLFRSAGSVAVTKAPLYGYRKRSGSITAHMNSQSAVELMHSINELNSKALKGSSGLMKAMSFKICLESSRLCEQLVSDGSDCCSQIRSEALQLLRKRVPAAFWNTRAPMLQRIRIVITAISPTFTRWINGLRFHE